MTKYNDRRTAIHEAGHAVMSFLLEQEIEQVSIVPGDECLGICRSTDDSLRFLDDATNEPDPFEKPEECQAFWNVHDQADALIEGQIMVLLAGRIAVEIHLGGSNEEEGSSDSDLQKAVDLTLMISGNAEMVTERWGELGERARQRLSDWRARAAVDRLAGELLARRTLTGAEAKEVCRATLSAEPPAS
jgi:hypothetical protein